MSFLGPPKRQALSARGSEGNSGVLANLVCRPRWAVAIRTADHGLTRYRALTDAKEAESR